MAESTKLPLKTEKMPPADAKVPRHPLGSLR
jgi:hypothetical protein